MSISPGVQVNGSGFQDRRMFKAEVMNRVTNKVTLRLHMVSNDRLPQVRDAR